MGDRANVYVHEGDRPGVYLYTHWEGSTLPQTVVRALYRGRGRWDDVQYLTRIIFSEMIQDDVLSETGFGISAECEDGGDRIVDVDTATQKIRFKGYDHLDLGESVPIGALPGVAR
jgi:hypothetical protein